MLFRSRIIFPGPGAAFPAPSATSSPPSNLSLRTLSPLPPLAIDTTNKYDDSPAAALMGQKLFFDPRLSGPIQAGTPQEGQLGAIGEAGKIVCRSCGCGCDGDMLDG
jgi:hypothetical protein